MGGVPDLARLALLQTVTILFKARRQYASCWLISEALDHVGFIGILFEEVLA